MNLHEIHGWLGERYGPVSYMHILGIRHVIVNGHKAVNEILNRHDLNARSSIGTIDTQKGVSPMYQTGKRNNYTVKISEQSVMQKHRVPLNINLKYEQNKTNVDYWQSRCLLATVR